MSWMLIGIGILSTLAAASGSISAPGMAGSCTPGATVVCPVVLLGESSGQPMAQLDVGYQLHPCDGATRLGLAGTQRIASGLLHTLGVYVDGVEGLAGGHKEAVAFCASETEVGAGFWEVDLADEFAVRSEDVDAVVRGWAPSGGGPDVAVGVAANAVGLAW
jgi:hypothetical protein